MSVEEVKDDSLAKAVVLIILELVCDLFRRDGSTPSVKPRKKKKVWFAWLSPDQGPGISHNPS